jgi:hypothetical protein
VAVSPTSQVVRVQTGSRCIAVNRDAESKIGAREALIK